MPMPPEDDRSTVELLLGTHPEFGDARAIEQRSLARLKVGLAGLATTVAAAGAPQPEQAGSVARAAAATDAELLALLRDPVLRHAFESDLRAAAGPDPADAPLGLPGLLALAQRGPGYAVSRLAATSAPTAWPALGRTWVLTDPPSGGPTGDPVGERLAQQLTRAFPDPSSDAPIRPTTAQLRTLGQAAELLCTLLPTVGSGVLRNIGMLGLAREDSADGPLHSLAGGDLFPATVFLSPEKLDNVWDAAGSVLHEGLHLTLFEIIRCGAMVRDGVDTEAEVVPIPWRVEAWSVMRVLFALHVYVHLALFHQLGRTGGDPLADRFGAPPPDAAMSRATLVGGDFGTPVRRARYLVGELRRRAHQFTGYGVRFVDWLADALDRLEPGPEGRPDSVGYRAVESAGAEYLPDQQRLVLALPGPLRLRWLNLSSWLVLSLCDGRDRDAIREAYVAAVAGRVPAHEAARQVGAALSELVAEGLVVIVPAPVPVS